MITENLSTLKIHKLSQTQYERELAAGRIDENALYLTPDEELALSDYEFITVDDIDTICGNGIVCYVDSQNNIIVSGGLDMGTYTVKYEMADGSTVNIGDLVLDNSEDEPVVLTNYADPASSDWKTDYRLSTSSGGASSCAGHTLTNFIPAKMGDVVRVKGLNMKAYVTDKPCAVGIYNASKAYQSNFVLTGVNGTSSSDAAGNCVTVNGDIYTYTILMDDTGKQRATADTAYIRIDGVLLNGYTKEDVVITINQEIE